MGECFDAEDRGDLVDKGFCFARGGGVGAELG